MPVEVLAIIWAVKWLTGTWKLHMGEDLLYISLNFCITERDTRWSLTAAGNKSYMIIKAARHSFLPTFWKQGHLFSAAIDFAYHISINKTLSQVLTFIFWREHYSLPHLSCVRNLQAAWEEFIGFLHIHVATYTTLNNFIILSEILCLRSWGWAHSFCCAHISPWQRACCSPFPTGTPPMPVSAPGAQGPEAVAELLALVCTCFLHTQPAWKWLWWLISQMIFFT